MNELAHAYRRAQIRYSFLKTEMSPKRTNFYQPVTRVEILPRSSISAKKATCNRYRELTPTKKVQFYPENHPISKSPLSTAQITEDQRPWQRTTSFKTKSSLYSPFKENQIKQSIYEPNATEKPRRLEQQSNQILEQDVMNNSRDAQIQCDLLEYSKIEMRSPTSSDAIFVSNSQTETKSFGQMSWGFNLNSAQTKLNFNLEKVPSQNIKSKVKISEKQRIRQEMEDIYSGKFKLSRN